MADWAQVEVLCPRTAADAVSALLIQAGAGGVQEDHPPGTAPPPRQPWDSGPEPPPPDPVVLRAWLEREGFDRSWEPLERALLTAGAGTARWMAVADQDWASTWRSSFTRVLISDRLAVAPPWLARPGDLVIDPGMAFGTGEHPSTRACLAATERLARPGGRCLDVGSGSGVVALLAARLGMRARGIDIEAEAVQAGRDNAARNDLQVDFDLTPLQRVQGGFDLVVANIYAEVLVQLAPDLARVCSGHLVLAGILTDRAHLVRQAMASQHLRLVQHLPEGEWTAMIWAS